MAYKAAEIDFRYLRFDRRRGTRFTDGARPSYCQSERAVDAGNAILVSHTIDGNLDQVESWTSRLQLKGCRLRQPAQCWRSQQARQPAASCPSARLVSRRRNSCWSTKRYEAAAAAHVRSALVEKNPQGVASSDKALNNAAVA